MNLLLAHLVGDYFLQSDWMAQRKTSSSWIAALHALTYTIPFAMLWWCLGLHPVGLLIVCGTHFVIDRWRLARFVCWAKNFAAPRSWWRPWRECEWTGYPPDRPAWLTVWLLIITDNTLHLLCNQLALVVSR